MEFNIYCFEQYVQTVMENQFKQNFHYLDNMLLQLSNSQVGEIKSLRAPSAGA